MKNKGFTVVEVVLVLVVVAVIGFVGYLAYTNFFAPKDAAETSQTAKQEPVTIESGSDVDKALSELDSLSIEDESDVSDFDAATKEFES
jgi:prepilin-type N-terminal cleavage/methylation domain-containing protein